MASALLLRHPESLAGAVLLAAMVPFADDEPRDHALAGKRVLIVNGDRDPMATPDTDHQADRTTPPPRRRRRTAVLPRRPHHRRRQLPHIKKFIDAGRPK